MPGGRGGAGKEGVCVVNANEVDTKMTSGGEDGDPMRVVGGQKSEDELREDRRWREMELWGKQSCRGAFGG